MSKSLVGKFFIKAEGAYKGNKAFDAGNYIKAKNAYQELYVLYKYELGEKHPDTLDALEALAISYECLGDYNKVFEMRKAVYNGRKEFLDENNPDTLTSLSNLAISYYHLGDYNKALKTENKVYNARKEVLGERDLDTLTSLSNLAIFYSNLGDHNKALEMENRVYNSRKQILGERDLDTLISLSNLAITYSDLGDYNKAMKLHEEVYVVRKQILGVNHPDTLTSLFNLAGSYSDLGDYSKAFELHNTVYNARKEILGEAHPDTLTSLSNLAISYSNLGDYNKSVKLHEEVYISRKQILGVNHSDTLRSLYNLAISYSDLGDYNKACELENIIYNARKEILGETHPDTLRSLSNLAISYSNLGDYNKAMKLHEEVYVSRKQILGVNHPDTLTSLSNLAGSYSDLGDYSKAFELHNTVYNIRKEILGERDLDTLTSLYNLACSYSDLGDYNKAFELHNTVYNVRKEILGERDLDTLTSLSGLASIYSCLGDYNKALEIGKEVYHARKEILGKKHFDTLSALHNLAIHYFYLEDYNKALETENIVYTETKDSLGEKHLSTLMALDSIAIYCSKVGDYKKGFEIAKSVYSAKKVILGESHPGTLIALSKLISRQIHQDKTDNQSIKKNMTAYFENINNLKKTAFDIKDVSSRRNFLKSFNGVYKLLKVSVFERNIKDLLDYLFVNKNLSFEMDVNRFHNKNMGERLFLKEISNMIGNQLIIDFYELDDSKYGLILIKKGKYSQCVVNYPDIINGSFINDKDIQLFIGSIRDYDHIYICPDGKLYNLSFERVLNCLNISYLSSVQTLFDNDTDDDNTDQLVSFIYPDFSGTQSEDNDRGDTKGVLYGSYLEGMFIHDIYGEKSTVYSSYQANHDNFFNTKRPRVLHVSTHGDYLDNEHMEPMDRGILCLSGYNVEDNNSGYISAKEIQYMDLKGTELVVLSACNTGLGENISGEGIYGIRRAFELAGCQTLLLTVEEVDDFNSAIFMKSFYERYNQTNNIYQSFKDTKEYLKEHGLKELKELRDVFEKEMKNKIKNPFIYTRNLNELNNRIEESETIGQIVRKKNNQYIQEDWNGFIIQGKIEN